MSERKAVVAILGTHAEAEGGVKELECAGLDVRSLSIVGKDSHTDEQEVGDYNSGEGKKDGGKNGAFWGGSMVGRGFGR